MATEFALARQIPRRAPQWAVPAWGAIAVTALFIGITAWWLTQDHSIPVFDAGNHLIRVQQMYRMLRAGHLGDALTLTTPYPPLAYLVGSLGFAVGGVNPTAPIAAENVVFAALLALGCYQLGKLAFGPTAGFLAVVFALGSPLVTAQFHVFMVDAPETAMVAVATWLIVASRAFSRVGTSALAGLAVGFGMLTKEPFAFFVAGVLGVALVRLARSCAIEGWRREYSYGLASFVACALAVALPWYIDQYSTVHGAVSSSIAQANNHAYVADIAPARFSIDNLTWYFWTFIGAQLYLPLFIFSAVGWIWMTIRLLRRQPAGNLAPELMVGAFVAWLAITETFVHDARYGEPLLIYLAVIGTGWITMMKRPAQISLIAVLAVVAIANTLGTSFGVGGELVLKPPGLHDHDVTIAMNTGFLVGAPKRDGDLLATFEAMRRGGVRSIDISPESVSDVDFSASGQTALADFAGLTPEFSVPFAQLDAQVAVFVHGSITASEPPPCVRLSDGSGVWIRLGNPNLPGARDYCPTRRPAFYD